MTTVERFEAKILLIPFHDCWEWDASTKGFTGYGAFTINSKPVSAHRAAWLLYRGSIPIGMSVLHRCDNRTCVNPAHLFLGTHTNNMQDSIRKGRFQGQGPTCLNGHSLLDGQGNWVWRRRSQKKTKGGKDFARFCRICACDRQRAYKQRIRAAIASAEEGERHE